MVSPFKKTNLKDVMCSALRDSSRKRILPKQEYCLGRFRPDQIGLSIRLPKWQNAVTNSRLAPWQSAPTFKDTIR